MTLLSLCLLSAFPAHAGDRISVDVPEPSGIDFDRRNGRIFVVDDGGELWVFDKDFREKDVFDLGGDLEGVHYLAGPDRLLVAVEGDEQLLSVDPDSGEELAVYDIPRTFQGDTVMAAGGNGIEALTVVGRRIFVANQSFDHNDDEDGSVLVELAMRPGGSLDIVDVHRLPMLDVAGSLYAPQSKSLFLLSDSDNRIYRLNLQALDSLSTGEDVPVDRLSPFSVPGVDQEGIALIDGHLIIAQDSGDLYDAGDFRWLMSDAGQLSTQLEWGD